MGPPLLEQLDDVMRSLRARSTGELRISDEVILPMLPSEYFARNCWLGVSQPKPSDVAVRDQIPADRFLWGSDYPHEEGTFPYTREHLRQVFPGTPEAEMRQILAGNAAALYGFDLGQLAPLGAAYGPTVAELAELPARPNQALLIGAR